MQKNILLSAAALAVALFMVVGCESADSYSVAIKASTTSIRAGQNVSLEGDGWDSFNWSVSDASLGYVSPQAGHATVYYSYQGKAGEQTVTAVSAGAQTSSTGTTTNQTKTVSSGYTASVRIVQSGETATAAKSASSHSEAQGSSGSANVPMP